MKFAIDRLSSPLGELWLAFEGGTLRALDFEDCKVRMRRLLELHYGSVALESGPAPRALRGALREYFAGETSALAEVPVATGGTPFQQRVWKALREIPVGSVISYGALAGRVGARNASRAVGAAVGANPVAIVVPCHRVLGADGSLTGYAGGLPRKRWLLAHEGAALGVRRTNRSDSRASGRVRRFLYLDRAAT